MANIIPDQEKCHYNYLGRSGLKVSNICLGAMTFGQTPASQGNLTEEASYAIIDRYVQWGGNFIDTADVYGKGASETVVGSWLAKQERENFVVATKVRAVMDDKNPNLVGSSRRHITSSIDKSLRRLQTDYVDLYQLHNWDDAVPLEETLLTLNDLVRCGKVRYLGASNFGGWQLQKVVEVSKYMGLNSFIALQQQYNLVSRFSEIEPFQVCKLNGLGVLPWSPLKGGFLSGKVKLYEKPVEGRLGRTADNPINIQSSPNWLNLDKRTELEKLVFTLSGKSVAQVALRWLLQKPVVSSVIIGVTKMEQLDDNMAAANGWKLTDEEMSELDDVSKPEVPYPYEMIRRLNASRANSWNPPGYV
ncbi:uncharacterized protein LOC112575844 isoform X3 [Pomacea canaliculata]|uniref:uncharacterized protein LOC112575844 isoform X3 n=1 Tax=Pomacea canaliculata TaxID=400727 RepID=UPI000D73657A|nr:uncharacterized protein LOC112575844 isoform X3 [Pomacea canaliculata]